jgi:hypothetical protein
MQPTVKTVSEPRLRYASQDHQSTHPSLLYLILKQPTNIEYTTTRMSVLNGLFCSCDREAGNNWLSAPKMQDDWTRNNQLRQTSNFNILRHLLPHLFLKRFESITFKNCYSLPHTITTQFISIHMLFKLFSLHTHWAKYFVKYFFFFFFWNMHKL